ncbi:Transposase for insertion sequence element IS905 [Bienertia sinuspersici]
MIGIQKLDRNGKMKIISSKRGFTKRGEMYSEEEFGKITIKPWQLFTDKQHLRDVVRDYCIQTGFSIIVEKANNKKWTVLCSDEGCGWRLHACRLSDGLTWIKNPMVTSKWAARVLLEDIRANNDIPAKSLNNYLWERYGVVMAPSTLYRMKSKAFVEIHGGFDESYAHLPNFCEIIKLTNPSSHAMCTWNSPTHPEKPFPFTSIFISFKASIDGLFSGCRSLIGVDGCHLKGNYGGVLLSAITLDGNYDIFPVAWVIVGSEDEESWMFFMHHLKNLLEPAGREDQWCIISDRQKGIDNSLSRLWLAAGRRYCYKHLSQNFKSKFNGPKMWNLFWLAYGAYSEFTFRKAMEAFQKTNPATRI